MKVYELFESRFEIEQIPNGKPSALYWGGVLSSQNPNRKYNSENISEIEAAILDGANKKFMIRTDDKIVAAIAFAQHDTSIHIEHLGSIKSGAGEALIKRAEEFARRKKLPVTLVPSSISKSFYERLGYSRVSAASQLWSNSINEGWKSQIASALTAGALATGASYVLDKSQELNTGKMAQQQQQLQKAIVRPITNQQYEKMLLKAAVSHGLHGEELAQFMAQCNHESWDFTKTVETRSDKSAEHKYGILQSVGKILGNIYRGDGAKYKGRSFIQVTGRYNYEQLGKGLGLDLINHPELLEDPTVAVKASLWYWDKRVKPKVSDFSDTAAVTKTINSKLRGLDDREDKFEKYKSTLTRTKNENKL